MSDGYDKNVYIKCSKCKELCLKCYNKSLCPDCTGEKGGTRTAGGKEDLVSHFSQDAGLRLQRMKWGHFR